MDVRQRFHDELAALESEVLGLGERAARALSSAVEALVHQNDEMADRVIAGDDSLDATYVDIEARILDLLARQTPVASDLRLVSAILHMNLHLERVGDMAVNIAKITKVTMELPSSDTVVSHLEEMGEDRKSVV